MHFLSSSSKGQDGVAAAGFSVVRRGTSEPADALRSPSCAAETRPSSATTTRHFPAAFVVCMMNTPVSYGDWR